MVDIYTSVNFFRNFGANMLLGKNTLKTRKLLLSDDHTRKQGLVPRFYHIEVIKYVKNYVQLNFYAIWRG